MFDRETRREKVLENMAKEARIRAAAMAEQTKGMKSAVISVKMKSKLAKDGWQDLRLIMGLQNKMISTLLFSEKRLMA